MPKDVSRLQTDMTLVNEQGQEKMVYIALVMDETITDTLCLHEDVVQVKGMVTGNDAVAVLVGVPRMLTGKVQKKTGAAVSTLAE